jgi:uncharacterized protein
MSRKGYITIIILIQSFNVNSMKTRGFLIILSVIVLISPLEAQVDQIAKMMEGYDMPENYKGFIDERYFISKKANITFKLNIYLPISYSETKRHYPILVMTDAFYSMGLAQTTFDLLTMYKEIPEVIVVGIDYPYSNMIQIVRNRFRDMMPTYVEGFNPSGKADLFISFLEYELFPYLQSEYRVDILDRCFFGHSAGGILGSHILIEHPYLFNRYIIGSPSLWWDNNEIVKRLEGKENLNFGPDYYVYSYIGSEEGDVMLNNWELFNKILTEKINPNMHFKQQVYEKESHASVTLSAFSQAIKFVYEKSEEGF